MAYQVYLLSYLLTCARLIVRTALVASFTLTDVTAGIVEAGSVLVAGV